MIEFAVIIYIVAIIVTGIGALCEAESNTRFINHAWRASFWVTLITFLILTFFYHAIESKCQSVNDVADCEGNIIYSPVTQEADNG